jgi:voltage-gated potassium channel
MKRTLRDALETYRSELLLATLIAAMLFSPLIDHHRRAGGVVAIIQLFLLAVGIFHLADMKIVQRVVVPVALIWLFARLVEAFGDPARSYTHLAPLAGLALSLAILWGLLRRFGSISKVTRSVISEAIISYLVIAIAFSQLYWILDHFVPNAFNKTIALGESGTFLYFSMITLSGVGYGGILPINSYVRLIAAFENITGLFYLALIISRLVSSYRRTPTAALPSPPTSQPPQ